MELDDHAEDLASDLGVDKEEVTDDLQNLVEYSVPIDEAKQSLRREVRRRLQRRWRAPSAKDIAEITTDDGNVTVTGVVLTAGERSIRYQGSDHVIVEGRLADETGVIDYTAWEDFGLAGRHDHRGQRGRPRVGRRTRTQSRREHLADLHRGVPEVPYESGGDAQLAELRTGDRAVTIEVSVLECERKTIDGRDGETDILSGVFGDESGRLPTNWDPAPEIEDGGTVRIENAYVQEFRGVPEVNVSNSRESPHSIARSMSGPTRRRWTPGDAVATGGIYDVEVGNLLAVRDGSGLVPAVRSVTGSSRRDSVEPTRRRRDRRPARQGKSPTTTARTVTVVLDDDLTERVYDGTSKTPRAGPRGHGPGGRRGSDP